MIILRLLLPAVLVIRLVYSDNQCNISKFININHHGKRDVIFNLSQAAEGELIFIYEPNGNVLYGGALGELIIPSISINEVSSRLKTLVNDKSMLKVEIRDVQKEDAGKYCCKQAFADIIPGCSFVLQVAVKPQINLVTLTSPVLQVTSSNIPQGEIILICSVTSTSKPDDHNLTMMYGWFIDGVFNRSTSPILDVDVTPDEREITCIATDYPACGQIINNTDQSTDLKTVKESSGCKDVLGVSSTLKILPEYGPYKIYIDPSGSEIKKKLSEKLKVKCVVKCNPSCDVHWLKDDVVVDDDDNDDSILYIDQLNVDDDGKYTCTATNIHGYIKTSFILEMSSAPVLVKYNSGFDKSMATLGKNISLSKMIMAYPKPKLYPAIIPSGVDLDRVNVYLRNDTSKPHHYIVMMEVVVMSKDYLGRYCVNVINTEGELQVRFLILGDLYEAQHVSGDWDVALLVAMVAVVMLIVVTMVVVFVVWRRYRPNNDDNQSDSTPHIYSTVV